ncbi:amino acid adenylation domain-containing protein [Streptomyces sp. NPDC014889]|uniref:amino acid adenylation domain-containing protein n=1 Tax=Streptomyces sp. NPDC014889 TaxID=3364928 RepID=UPI0036F9052D
MELSAELDSRDVLTALVAVISRRTLRERIRVSGQVTTELDLTADPTFAELSARVHALVDDRFAVRVDDMELTASDMGTALGGEATDDLEHVVSQVCRALADGLREPSRRVSVLELASDADRALVATFEGSGTGPAPARCIQDLVGEQARRTPDIPAVSAGAEEITYQQLVDRADLLAERLAHAGAGPGHIVGVLGERSPETIISLLAVLKVGAAYLALAPEWPDARLDALLSDASVKVVLTPEKLAGRIPGDLTVLPFDASPEVQRTGLRRPPVGLTPDHLAYVSYTSGSTGEPKGVCVPHAAVSRLVCSPDWAVFGPTDVFLQVSPISFDASVLEIWAPLCNGGRVVLLPPGRVDVGRMGEVIRTERVTHLWLTAGLFHQMVGHQLSQLSRVRHLFAGGDVVSPQAVAQLLGAHPRMLFTNGYGPTENTTFTACATFHDPPPQGPVPIGRPISGTRVKVLDAEGKAVPPGVVGELYAAGAGLAHGYLGRPAATADRFVPDPSGTSPGARLYRTGDLARWRSDGMLDFCGRADNQVKINGYRVEPDEIAAVLTTHPEVRSAAVVDEVGSSFGKHLVGYVVPVNSSSDTQQLGDLRGWLRDRFPEYLVPARIVTLAELPLTLNGKVAREALPKVHTVARSVPNDYVAPRVPVEQLLCQLWSETLNIEMIGIDDDFFELGGHSLIAADLLARLQNEYGIEIPARTLYLSPTVGELAELAELEPLRARLG